MDKEFFDDLICSLKEAGDIAKGIAPASRRFEADPINVKELRMDLGLSQNDFARLMRVSVKTLQNWEQHRRTPSGPAAALLTVVSREPEAALKSLHG